MRLSGSASHRRGWAASRPRWTETGPRSAATPQFVYGVSQERSHCVGDAPAARGCGALLPLSG